MNKMLKTTVYLIFISLSLASQLTAQEIVYANVDTIIQLMPEYKKAQEAIEDYHRNWKTPDYLILKTEELTDFYKRIAKKEREGKLSYKEFLKV
ncbi:MAG: hypothetical protein MK212_21450, partial [Saprospiraceae bacterium]|nr:hypothetical protein [Saprospiraceae bacterium]